MDLNRKLLLPDPKLLQWSEEDKYVHSEACTLGGNLQAARELYEDIQNRYKNLKMS